MSEPKLGANTVLKHQHSSLAPPDPKPFEPIFADLRKATCDKRAVGRAPPKKVKPVQELKQLDKMHSELDGSIQVRPGYDQPAPDRRFADDLTATSNHQSGGDIRKIVERQLVRLGVVLDDQTIDGDDTLPFGHD